LELKLYKKWIISYNVNEFEQRPKDLFLAATSKSDVICLQEIKATPEQIPLLDFELAGYPYHYWFPATKKDTVEQQFCLKLNQ
jgi:exodeoxyribonuclease-3